MDHHKELRKSGCRAVCEACRLYFFIALSIVFGTLSLWGQPTPIGLGSRIIKRAVPIDTLLYDVTYQMEVETVPGQSEWMITDEVLLQIGKNATKSFSIALAQVDSVATVLYKSGARTVPMYQGLAQVEVIYRMNRKDQLLVDVRDLSGDASLYYSEVTPKLKWKMGHETKDILGYSCRSARVDFRGRCYTAWYAPDIPLSYGPWKFAGLPGLILDIRDDTGEVHYTATGFRKAQEGEMIMQSIVSSRSSTREKCNAALKYMFAHPAQYSKATSGIVLSHGDTILGESHYCPYNPIELE